MKQRSRTMGLGAWCVLLGALAGLGAMSGCSAGDERTASAEKAPTNESVEESTTAIDDNTVAHAARDRSGVVSVDIDSASGKRLFTAEYHVASAGKYRVDYTLYPAGDAENQTPAAETSSLELELENAPTLDEAVNGAVMIQSQFESAVLGNYDNWGCDLLPRKYNWIASCGPKGRCCDTHDACYKKHHCTASSWKKAPWNKCQLLCNAPAVACFIASNPGPSACCFKGNCGKPR